MDDKLTKFKIAKAKAVYEELCSTVEFCEKVLIGQARGSKKCWNMVENTIFRGKHFFSDVKSIKELVQSITEGGADDEQEKKE